MVRVAILPDPDELYDLIASKYNVGAGSVLAAIWSLVDRTLGHCNMDQLQFVLDVLVEDGRIELTRDRHFVLRKR